VNINGEGSAMKSRGCRSDARSVSDLNRLMRSASVGTDLETRSRRNQETRRQAEKPPRFSGRRREARTRGADEAG